MGFIYAGNPCFLQPTTPICLSCFSAQSVFPPLYLKNANKKKKNMSNSVSVASLRHQEDSIFCKRKAILLLGISVFPLFHPKTRSFEGLAADEHQLITTRETDESEKNIQKVPSLNPLLALLNRIGILGLGAITALYASVQRDKKATDATIESMETKLKEKEEEIVLLEKNFESKLLNEQELWNRQLRMAKEEENALLYELDSANITVTKLCRELNDEKRSVQELKNQGNRLHFELIRAEEEIRRLEEYMKVKLTSMSSLEDKLKLLSIEIKEKENIIQQLTSSVADKEVELKNLKFRYMQILCEQEKANMEFQGLKDEFSNCKNELVSKIALMDDLNSRVSSLTVERDTFKKHLDAAQDQYNVLQSSLEDKAAVDAKLLEEREFELHELKGKLGSALQALKRDHQEVFDLTQERDGLQKLLNSEISNVENLTLELQTTRENLVKSTNEASDLTEQLKHSRIVCAELESEISTIKTEFAETKDLLRRSIDEAKLSSEELASEITIAKEGLKKTMDDLQIVSHELSVVIADREGLQKELVDVYKRLESADSDLKDEKNITSSLNEKLEAVEKQNLNDKEARTSLEIDLEEATKALNGMNQNSLALSKEVEKVHSHISSLEEEKEVLYRSLSEERNLSKEARENMEDAHNLVMRLGKERDTWGNKAKRLEEELASAKGEILRLRSHINSAKTSVDNKPLETDKAEGKVTVTAKRNTRRRKAKSQ